MAQSKQNKQPKGKDQEKKKATNYIVQARNFLNEVVEESKKIVWPSRETMVQSSLTVLGAITILTAFMGFADLFWGWVFNFIMP